MITIKLKLIESINVNAYMKQYTNVCHFAYNRLFEGKSITQTEKFIKSTMNNIELIDASFIKVAVNEMTGLINESKKCKRKTVIFGGKNNWSLYNKGKIIRLCKEALLEK